MQFNLVGLRFRPASAKLAFATLSPGDEVGLEREPDNPHDPNAIQVVFANEHIGYVPALLAVTLAATLDAAGGTGRAVTDVLLPPWVATFTVVAPDV